MDTPPEVVLEETYKPPEVDPKIKASIEEARKKEMKYIRQMLLERTRENRKARRADEKLKKQQAAAEAENVAAPTPSPSAS
jgi:hypothetical protein